MDQTRPDRPPAAIFWMFITGLCFVAVTGLVRLLGPDLPAAEAAFLRYLLGLVFLLPMIRPILRARLGRGDLWLFTLRGAAHTVAVTLWFFAMARIPVAEVTAMNYMYPVYITIGAALFLGEGFAARRLAAVLVALAGSMIILRPGFKEVTPGHVAMIFAAMAFGASYLGAKVASGRVSAPVVVGMLSITVTIGLAPLAFAVWVPPNATQLGIIFLVACFATAAHYAMTLAMAAAPVSVSQPVVFLQLLWAVLLGWFAFGEAVDAFVILGGAMIIGAISFIAWREAMGNRRAAATR